MVAVCCLGMVVDACVVDLFWAEFAALILGFGYAMVMLFALHDLCRCWLAGLYAVGLVVVVWFVDSICWVLCNFRFGVSWWICWCML